jgi:hypothetical protein
MRVVMSGLPTKLLLQNLQHVSAVAIAPVSNESERVGIVFYEASEKLNGFTFALDLGLSTLSLIVHLLLQGSLRMIPRAYTASPGGGE